MSVLFVITRILDPKQAELIADFAALVKYGVHKLLYYRSVQLLDRTNRWIQVRLLPY